MRVIVTCSFSEQELQRIDQMVREGRYCSRSDAIRSCTNECMIRRGII